MGTLSYPIRTNGYGQRHGPQPENNVADTLAEQHERAFAPAPEPIQEIPMEVKYTVPNGRLTFTFDVQTGKQAFQAVAKIQELFEEPECGCCQSKAIACACREWEGNQYYNLKCSACGAQLDFGQNKDGKGLFVKRWDKETNSPMPNRGWYVYQKGERTRDTHQTAGYKTPTEPPDEGGDMPF